MTAAQTSSIHLLNGLLTDLAAGVVTSVLYSPDHPRAEHARTSLVEKLGLLHAARDQGGAGGEPEVSILLLDGELFVQGRPITRMGDQVGSLVRRLGRHEIERILFRPGTTAEEVGALLEFLADAPGAEPPPLPHVAFGRVVVRDGAYGSDRPPEDEEVVVRDRVGIIQDVFSSFVAGRPLSVVTLEDLVAGLARRLQRTEDPLNLLAPVEDPLSWPAAHAYNTAVLSLMLTIPLGLDEEARLDLGLAAVLHDLGKVDMAPELVHQELALEGEPWELVPDHPRRGLELLLRTSELPPIVPIVAFEHHLEMDGGGFPSLPEPRPPHPAAALVAVAERFDILHTVRAPRGVVARDSLGAVLEQLAGATLDPFMVQTMRVIWELSEMAGRDRPESG